MAWPALLAAADRAALQHLGGAVVYTPAAGAPVDVAGIFEAAYVKAAAGPTGVSTCGPAVFLRLSDLPSDPVTDLAATITVGGVTYSAKEAQPDGQGGILLLLHQV